MYAHSSTETNTGILVCGGRSFIGYHDDCYEYRTSGNSWVRMPSMTKQRAYFDMIFLNGKVYAVGGRSGSSRYLNSMDIFDATTMIWTQQSIPFSVIVHCVTQLSADQLILIGGQGSNGVSKNVISKKDFNPTILFYCISLSKVFFTNYLF